MPHFMIVLILYISLLNLSWTKMSIFEEYGAFNMSTCNSWKTELLTALCGLQDSVPNLHVSHL